MRLTVSCSLAALALLVACAGDETREVVRISGGPGPAPQELCEGDDTLQADVDGDAREDRAYHRWVESRSGARLGVCTAAGQVDDIEGAGQAEGTFEAIDVEPDGRFELAFGATTVSQSLASVAVFLDGRLEVVTVTATGDPLVLADGPVDETSGEAWGCESAAGGHTRRLVQVTVRHNGAAAEWTRTFYRVDGAVASQIGVEPGSGPVYETPSRHAAALVPPC